jgi:hypothetical protein
VCIGIVERTMRFRPFPKNFDRILSKLTRKTADFCGLVWTPKFAQIGTNTEKTKNNARLPD